MFNEWLLRERGRIVDSSGASSSRDITFTQSELAAYALGQLRPITQLIAQSEPDMMDFLKYVNKWPKLAALKGSLPQRGRGRRALAAGWADVCLHA